MAKSPIHHPAAAIDFSTAVHLRRLAHPLDHHAAVASWMQQSSTSVVWPTKDLTLTSPTPRIIHSPVTTGGMAGVFDTDLKTYSKKQHVVTSTPKTVSDMAEGVDAKKSKGTSDTGRGKVSITSMPHGTSLSIILDEVGAAPASDTTVPDVTGLLELENKLQSEKQMSQKILEKSSQAYDKQLLSRIGGARTAHFRGVDNSTEESPRHSHEHIPANGLCYTRSDRGLSHFNKSSGFNAQTPHSSLASHAPQFQALRNSATFNHENGVLPDHSRDATMTLEGSHIHHKSKIDDYSQHKNIDEVISRRNHDLSLTNSDSSVPNLRAGQKRRAQSPLSVDNNLESQLIDTPGIGTGSWRTRQLSRTGAESHQPPQLFQGSSSASSNSSSTLPTSSIQSSSHGFSSASSSSNYLVNPSSSKSYFTAETTNEPYGSMSTSGSGRGDPVRTVLALPRSSAQYPQRASGLWICDCCPKKPKKFDSEDELRIHELEKQYICQYCHNRFKNKNEAERHQNSLHLRRHSWSCASLTSFEAAFHCTPSNTVISSINGTDINSNNIAENGGSTSASSGYLGSLHSTPTDTCGYCGQEFINPPDWEDRVEHLNHVHKFGECNQSKKFFRADHFRQHLKHSHAGTSGKWTNMLENACMKDELPDRPIDQNQLQTGMSGITVVGEQQLLAAAAAAAAVGVGQGYIPAFGPSLLMQSQLPSPSGSDMTHSNAGDSTSAPHSTLQMRTHFLDGPISHNETSASLNSIVPIKPPVHSPQTPR